LVKKSFFLKKIRGIVLATLIILSVFAGVSEARRFVWDNSNICTPSCICGNFVYVWTLEDYCSLVPTDCEYDTRPYDQVPGGKGVSVPAEAQIILKKNYLIKVRTLPESYEVKAIEITKQTFPVPYDKKYVSVVVSYERETTGSSVGRELESDFSNRLMWSTPKELNFTIELK
jgi:hypothetical protein